MHPLNANRFWSRLLMNLLKSNRLLPRTKLVVAASRTFSNTDRSFEDKPLCDIKNEKKSIDKAMTLVCCMSACADCVWIEYAESLLAKYKDGGDKARDMITEEVEDPNMKAYLLLELSILTKKENKGN